MPRFSLAQWYAGAAGMIMLVGTVAVFTAIEGAIGLAVAGVILIVGIIAFLCAYTWPDLPKREKLALGTALIVTTVCLLIILGMRDAFDLGPTRMSHFPERGRISTPDSLP